MTTHLPANSSINQNKAPCVCVFFFGCSFEWEKLGTEEIGLCTFDLCTWAKQTRRFNYYARWEWPTAACIITMRVYIRTRFFLHFFMRAHWERMAMLDLESKSVSARERSQGRIGKEKSIGMRNSQQRRIGQPVNFNVNLMVRNVA